MSYNDHLSGRDHEPQYLDPNAGEAARQPHLLGHRMAKPFKRLGKAGSYVMQPGFPVASRERTNGLANAGQTLVSGDDHFEILVSPLIADSMRVAGILAHEIDPKSAPEIGGIALLAPGQIVMRKVGGWQRLAEKPFY